MKIKLLVIGKTEEEYLRTGIAAYAGRITHYLPFEIKEIPALKNIPGTSRAEWKQKEGEKLLKMITPGECIVLLDERGKEMTSVEFSGFLNQKMTSGIKILTFIVGGPFGFDEVLKKKAAHLISLSRMTFSHQMVRLFFTEQLYRAMTILKNEAYHHE